MTGSLRAERDSVLITTATAAMMSAPPAMIAPVIGSLRINQPKKMAIAGFTYANVMTLDTGACCSNQV